MKETVIGCGILNSMALLCIGGLITSSGCSSTQVVRESSHIVRIYDNKGDYAGYTDGKRFYDANGNFIGMSR